MIHIINGEFMKKFNRELTIIAYYLSEYNNDVVSKLGYSNQSKAFEGISKFYNKKNNYLRFRRDEFDVLTSSPRQGWKNRKPAKDMY